MYRSSAWKLPLIIVGIALNLVRVVLGSKAHVVSPCLTIRVPVVTGHAQPLVTDYGYFFLILFLDRRRG